MRECLSFLWICCSVVMGMLLCYFHVDRLKKANNFCIANFHTLKK